MHPEYFHLVHGISAAIKNLDMNLVFSEYTSCTGAWSEVLEQADAEYTDVIGYLGEILWNFRE